MDNDKKGCSRCSKVLPQGRKNRFCSPCQRAYMREFRTQKGSEYVAWAQMMERCTKPRHKAWANYGGRGIKVCEYWLRFENFIADMGRKPAPGLSLDRIDNDGNYEPGNCRWATKSEQARNTRSVHLITIDGLTKPVTVWERELGISHLTIKKRFEKAP